MKLNNLLLTLVLCIFSVYQLDAQDYWLSKPDNYKIKPILAVQMWGTYTSNQKVFNTNTLTYDDVPNRANMMLRRSRFGFSAAPLSNLKITSILAIDMVGRDLRSGVIGPANNGGSPNVQLWDLFGQWQIQKGNEAFNLIFGYFTPQFSRESNTSPWNTTSFEKPFSQFYIRQHLVGTGPGRAAGLNLGGLFLNPNKKIGFNYAIGAFNPLYFDLNGNSMGNPISPLYTGRLVMYIGDPEMTKYSKGHKVNYMNERKGLSIAGNIAYQDETNLFEKSIATSADILFNWDALNLDAEWISMRRDGQRRLDNGSLRDFTSQYTTGHFRVGYNLIINNKYFIEPVFMAKFMNGALDVTGQADAASVGHFSGIDHTYDVGVNWFLNKNNLVLKLHYTWREGDAGDAPNGFDMNNFFSQGGVGAIQRGNYIGIGLEAKL